MIKTYLINLDRRTDRLDLMRAQLHRLSINHERISAVDGVALPSTLVDQFMVGGEIASKLSPGEVGCYASHLLAYERIVESGLPFAIVLEDDMILDDDFLATAWAAANGAPKGWDVIKLCNRVKRRSLIGVTRVAGRHLVRFTKQPYLTGAYLISRAGAVKLLAPRLRIRPIDMETRMPWLLGLEQFGVVPPPARDGGFASDIVVRGTKRSPQYDDMNLGDHGYLAKRSRLVTRLKCKVRDALRVPGIVEELPHD